MTTVTEHPIPPSDRRKIGTVPLVLGATSLGALAAAGILEWQVGLAASDLDRAAARQDTRAYDDALQRGERLQLAGKGALITGGVLLGAAVVTWLVTRGKPAQAAVQPEPGRLTVTF